MNKPFIDLDVEAEKQAGMSIPELFQQQGEQAFRQIESKLCKKFGAKNGMVLSTGGGVVKKSRKYSCLAPKMLW